MTANNASLEVLREPQPVVSVANVTCGYGRTTVLRDVSVALQPGSFTALVGPNGAGKTTLVRAISGHLPISSGRISISDAEVTRLPAHHRAAAGMCLIPEGRGIYKGLTVMENLRMQARRHSLEEGLELAFGAFPVLERRLGQKAGTLSGGEQQMLAMSAAYMSRPKVVIVDEASTGLAPVVVDQVFLSLAALARGGVTLLVVDQYANRILGMADYAYVLGRGSVAYQGRAADLLRSNLFEKYLAE